MNYVKSIKKVVVLTMSSIMLLSSSTKVGATGMSSYKSIGYLTPGHPTEVYAVTTVYNCTYSGSGGVTGEDLYCSFNNFGSLDSRFKSKTGRTIEAYLWDEDPWYTLDK